MRSKFGLMFSLFICILSLNAMAFNEDCDVIETTGNSISTVLEEGLNSAYVDKEVVITSTQKLKITKISELEFKGCMLSFQVNFDLMREIFGDTMGHILLAGNITEVNLEHICLNEIQASKLSIEGAGEIETELYLAIANHSLPESKCFKW